tara:strand:- start:16 stop:273 length:258 start_codon:yes stop_codon:yes gene_type:complete
MKKKYSLTIDDSMIISEVNLKEFILNHLKSGDKTVASVIAKEIGRNKKRVSETLNQLEEEGYFTSEDKLIRYNGGAAWSKVFTRV